MNAFKGQTQQAACYSGYKMPIFGEGGTVLKLEGKAKGKVGGGGGAGEDS
jgi:hypothetical protein